MSWEPIAINLLGLGEAGDPRRLTDNLRNKMLFPPCVLFHAFHLPQAHIDIFGDPHIPGKCQRSNIHRPEILLMARAGPSYHGHVEKAVLTSVVHEAGNVRGTDNEMRVVHRCIVCLNRQAVVPRLMGAPTHGWLSLVDALVLSFATRAGNVS